MTAFELRKYEVVKYYTWQGNDHADDDGFWDKEEAIEYAKKNDCTEVEMTCWLSEENYEDRGPADAFEVVWRKGW